MFIIAPLTKRSPFPNREDLHQLFLHCHFGNSSAKNRNSSKTGTVQNGIKEAGIALYSMGMFPTL